MPNPWTGKGNPYTRTEVIARLRDTMSKGKPIIAAGAGTLGEFVMKALKKDAGVRNDDERFDGDFMLMTGELAKLMADVVEALGGDASSLNSVDVSDVVKDTAVYPQ